MIGETAEIGKRVTLYQGVTLGGTGFQRGKRHPTLGDNVTVGSGAKLLGPIAVGDGAKIGANTVVVEDVPPGSTVVGNPGHPVRVEGQRVEGPDADWIHLPDPIAEAIKALSERIAEARGAARRARRRRAAACRRGRSCARARAAPPPAAEPVRPAACLSMLGAMLQETDPETSREASGTPRRPDRGRRRPRRAAAGRASTSPSARRCATARGRCSSSPAPAPARPAS